MKIYLTEQQPSSPAACVPATYESIVGRSGAWAPPMPMASERRLIAPVPTSGHRTSVSIARMVPGNGVAVVNRQFTGDARGVPPRGRPV